MELQQNNKTDTTTFGFEQEFSLATGVLLILISFSTIVANTLLLSAIYLDPFKCFRTPPVVFIANLALADLLTGLAVDPLYAAYDLGVYQGKDYSTAVTVGDYGSYITVNNAIVTIIFLSIDRSVAIRKPFTYRRLMTLKTALVIVAIAWVYSAFFSTFRLMGMSDEAYVMLDTHLHVTFAFASLSSLFVFIYRNLKQDKKNTLRATASTRSTEFSQSQQKLQDIKSDKRLLVTIFLILLAFFLCFAPYAVFIHLEFYCDHCQGSKVYFILSKTSEPFVYLNSALNPFIYAWRHKNFRKALGWVVRCRGRPSRYRGDEGRPTNLGETNSVESTIEL